MMELSYSRMATWLRCPQLYLRKYVEREEPESVQFALLFGGSVHDALGAEAQRRLEGKEGGGAYAIGVFRETLAIKMKNPEAPVQGLGNKTLDEHFALGDAMIRAYFADGAVDRLIEVEKPITLQFGWQKLIGFVDFVVDGDNGPEIVELKTSRASYSESRIQLNMQATVYAAAMGAKYREVPVHFRVLTKAKVPKVQRFTTTRGPADVAMLEETMSGIGRGLLKGVFPRNTSPQTCSTCPYRTSCLGMAHAA